MKAIGVLDRSTKQLTTLPPIIMEVKNGSISNGRYLSSTAISNSMIMGERVKKAYCTVDGPEMLLQFSLVVYSEKDTIHYLQGFISSPHFYHHISVSEPSTVGVGFSISPKKDSYEQSRIVEEICFYKTVAKQDFGENQFLRTLQ